MNTKLDTYYQFPIERDRLFSSKANSLEFFTNMHLFQKYLRPSSRILELGAGHGIYSINLAKQGHSVVATDVVQENVNEIEKTITANNLLNISVQNVNATDLSCFSDSEFDAVLSLGPYYHLRAQKERIQSLREAKRVIKDDGLVCIAYINKAFALAYFMKNNIYFSKAEYEEFLKTTWEKHDFKDSFLNISYYTTPEDIEHEVELSGLRIIEHSASDGMYTMIKSNIEKMNENEFNALREYHISTAHCFSSLGASSHNLIVAKK